MAAIVHPLLTLLASLPRQDLAQQVTYLKAENRILRSKLPDGITRSNQERRTPNASWKREWHSIHKIVPLERPPDTDSPIEATERLGGLLRSYRRTA